MLMDKKNTSRFLKLAIAFAVIGTLTAAVTMFLWFTPIAWDISHLRADMNAAPVETVIYCIEGDLTTPAIKAYADAYSESVRNSNIKVVCFSSEAELSEAMDQKTPDLFICDFDRAVELNTSGRLQYFDSGVCAAEYLSSIQALSSDIGKSIFPISAEAEILVARKDYIDSMPTTLQELLEETNGFYTNEPENMGYLYISDFCSLLNRAVKERGGVFTAEMSRGKTFTDTYNLLADAVYGHKLVYGDYDPINLIDQKIVICSIAPAHELIGASLAKYDYYEVPPAGQNKYVTGRMRCLVVPEGKCDTLEARTFLHWLLESKKLLNIAMNTYCVPCVTLTGSGNDIQLMLQSMAAESQFYQQRFSSKYNHNRNSFEAMLISEEFPRLYSIRPSVTAEPETQTDPSAQYVPTVEPYDGNTVGDNSMTDIIEIN